MLLEGRKFSSSSNATVLKAAPDAVAVVDEIVGVPELLHLEEPSVVFTKVSENKYKTIIKQQI